jgi:4-amino-4-deoxy-L-arabinose transferase-like glycosyltransferase
VVPIVVLAVMGAIQVWIHRPFGTWDAFMIYDRSARFVYRGGNDWMQTFSPDIDPAFHADYPLLISMDIAHAWNTLGHESQSVPRVLGGLFMLVCAGLFASALTMLKSIWQAALGAIVLLNTPFFILSGPSQTADVPLSFFILSTVALLFFFCTERKPGLLVLAGLSAGLAAWTKNEGDVFIIGILAGLFIAFLRQDLWRRLGLFLAGLAVPLAIVLYFKVFLAPANDILGTSMAGLIQRAFEWSRHLAILRSFRGQILIIGGPTVSVILLLTVYALVFGVSPQRNHRPAYIAVAITAAVQAAGYYAIYLVTPHPIQWQLDFSLWRVLFHIYLPLLFVFFVLVTDVPRALGFQHQALPAESIT